MTTTLPSERDDTPKPQPYVKFRGMKAADGVPDDIALGDVQEFTGRAECVHIGTEKRADGEQRPVIGMRVLDVELGDVTPAPRDGQLALDEDDTPLGDQP